MFDIRQHANGSTVWQRGTKREMKERFRCRRCHRLKHNREACRKFKSVCELCHKAERKRYRDEVRERERQRRMLGASGQHPEVCPHCMCAYIAHHKCATEWAGSDKE